MCGINGIIEFKKGKKIDSIEQVIQKMNDAIIHRGPDQGGFYIKDGIGMGMRRLSIIDLEMGNQPIFNEDKSLLIFLNGEIYNYKKLRDDLINRGHHFKTQSDTEVALHCFEEYGFDSFAKLNGMFSLAVYDTNKDLIYIARDRVGEKPLYYYYDDDIFLYSSELKSITCTRLFEKKICKKALSQYLSLTYIPSPITIYEKIYKLPAGSFMIIDVKNRDKVKIKNYWNVEYSSEKNINNYDECKKLLRKTLFNAVEECMISDVPIGAFMSGGIDSTVIVGIMSKIHGSPINTFTIGYHDKEYDESERAKKAASLNKTKHHHFMIGFDDIIPEIEKILSNIDEPFSDSSLLPTYMISKKASSYVKTVLTGDGGDELFAGYNKYLISYYSKKYNMIPRWMRENIINKIIYKIPDRTNNTRKIRKVIENARQDIFTQRLNLMTLGFKSHELKKLIQHKNLVEEYLEMIKSYYHSPNSTVDELTRAMYVDFKVVLEGDMLPKVDRASMLNSLEARVPLLHKDVIELSSKIPTNYKINKNNTKIIFKDTFSDLIPKELLRAPKKGFSVPIGTWFKNELKQNLLDLLDEEFIKEQGLFNYDYIAGITDEHFTEKRNRSSELWTLFVFQNWFKTYHDSSM